MDNSKKLNRILFLVKDLSIGGGDRLLLELVRFFCDKAIDTTIFAGSINRNNFFELKKNVNVVIFSNYYLQNLFTKLISLKTLILYIYIGICFLFSSIKKNFDLVIVHEVGFVLIPLLKLMRYKVIHYCHFPEHLALRQGGGLFSKLYLNIFKSYENFCLSLADCVIVNSEYTMQTTISSFSNVYTKSKKDSNFLSLLYPCINEDFLCDEFIINRESIKLEEFMLKQFNLKISDNLFIFTSINRFVPFKNFELAIEAFKLFRMQLSCESKSTLQKGETLRPILILIGGTSSPESVQYLSDLRRIASSDDIMLQDSIYFVTSPSDSIMKYILSRTKVLLYTPPNEHFGIVPLEASIFRIPTIAINSGGPKETIVNDVTGYLCENDSSQFAEKMDILYKKSKKLLNMGDAAYQRYFQYFSKLHFFYKFYDILVNQGFKL